MRGNDYTPSPKKKIKQTPRLFSTYKKYSNYDVLKDHNASISYKLNELLSNNKELARTNQHISKNIDQIHMKINLLLKTKDYKFGKESQQVFLKIEQLRAQNLKQKNRIYQLSLQMKKQINKKDRQEKLKQLQQNYANALCKIKILQLSQFKLKQLLEKLLDQNDKIRLASQKNIKQLQSENQKLKKQLKQSEINIGNISKAVINALPIQNQNNIFKKLEQLSQKFPQLQQILGQVMSIKVENDRLRRWKQRRDQTLRQNLHKIS